MIFKLTKRQGQEDEQIRIHDAFYLFLFSLGVPLPLLSWLGKIANKICAALASQELRVAGALPSLKLAPLPFYCSDVLCTKILENGTCLPIYLDIFSVFC